MKKRKVSKAKDTREVMARRGQSESPSWEMGKFWCNQPRAKRPVKRGAIKRPKRMARSVKERGSEDWVVFIPNKYLE